MTLSRVSVWLLGIGTFVQPMPFVTAILFLGRYQNWERAAQVGGAVILIVSLILDFVLIAGLAAFYIVHATKTPLSTKGRALWIIGIIIGGPLVEPFYWYRQILRVRNRCVPTGETPQSGG